MTLVAIFGPTASGKSAIALELAAMCGGEIVSCDAMQLYRGLPILTNQPSAAELAAVPHHLVAVWELDEEGDVARYAALAHAAIDEILARGRLPIVCGGTGLYLRAVLTDLALPPRSDPELRARLTARYDAEGAERTHALLATLDPAAATRVHPNDRRRVVRALELHELGSSLAPRRDRLWDGQTRVETLIAGVAVPRAELRRRIAERTAAMFARGVAAEVAAATAERTPSATASRALGLDLLTAPADDAEARLTSRTCAYARRQETWMRRIPGLVTLDGSAPPVVAAGVLRNRLAVG